MTNAWLAQAASLGLHVGALALLSLLVPPALGDAEIDADDVAFIRRVLAQTGAGTDDDALGRENDRAGAERDPIPSSSAGPGGTTPPTASTPARIEGIENRAEVLRQASSFGMNGLLAGSAGAGDLGPSAWAGRGEAAIGGDLWGDAIGDSFGIGGIALSGVGEGAGGRGEGIAIGEVGVLGRGLGESMCAGSGSGFGCGCGHGVLGESHRTRAPVLRCGSPPDAPREPDGSSSCQATVNGRLPAEAVQRVVRQSFGRFRLCYDEGLRRNPTLEGRVSVNFVIDRQGAVSMAADGGSDLPDADVVACVVRGFAALSFPEPAGGVVTVVYPLAMSVGP